MGLLDFGGVLGGSRGGLGGLPSGIAGVRGFGGRVRGEGSTGKGGGRAQGFWAFLVIPYCKIQHFQVGTSSAPSRSFASREGVA